MSAAKYDSDDELAELENELRREQELKFMAEKNFKMERAWKEYKHQLDLQALTVEQQRQNDIELNKTKALVEKVQRLEELTLAVKRSEEDTQETVSGMQELIRRQEELLQSTQRDFVEARSNWSSVWDKVLDLVRIVAPYAMQILAAGGTAATAAALARR